MGTECFAGQCERVAMPRDIPVPLRLREGSARGASTPVREEESSLEDEEKRMVFCKACNHPISTTRKTFSVDGASTHTFFNPAGIVFEIMCFSAASGCLVQGDATSHFSWFAGHTWRLAFCGNCLVHLGWFFESEDASFFGLIVNKLAGDL